MYYRVGGKTKVRKLEREDVDRMLLWGKHESPEFLHYNFPNLSEAERDLWYRIKARDYRKRCFAIEDMKDNLVGYISLRNIKFFRRQSELGIVFDPSKLSKGYGTDGLCTFLDLYFNDLKMRILVLKVAKFNKRALRCYEKCGFEISGEVFHEFEEQNLGTSTMRRIEQTNEGFAIENGKLMTNYYSMYITREKYLFHKENKELLITL
ncbi:GNAT family N-acetyltransferase [Wukongibacter sp. M2B1]|uniref:GNAT family N-acetyltransferase n=1 Tax=Wukongibacter sp. M2B1 TaxID=3088895 RepID=UPI003D7A324D